MIYVLMFCVGSICHPVATFSAADAWEAHRQCTVKEMTLNAGARQHESYRCEQRQE
jgi:hypothetical protein